jgi:purine nucleosidase
MSDRTAVVLDTDIGTDIDDAVCLAYLLAQPRCELVGVTTVAGDARARARLADAVCQAAGRTDVPVVSGCGAPLMVQAAPKPVPQAAVLPRWKHREEFDPCAAVEFLRRAIRGRPGEITLLTIGPLTNAGLLCAVDPEAASMLKSVVMMGGRYVTGNRMEYNTCADPYAAELCFRAPAPSLTAFGLDVTLQCTMPADECRARLRGGPLDVVIDMAEVWFRERDRICFHDPLAAACLFEPDLCAYRDGAVSVNLEEGNAFGRTDFAQDPAGPHRVAVEVDAQAFFAHYFDTVGVFQG